MSELKMRIENTPKGKVAFPVVFEPEIKVDEKTGKRSTIYRSDLIFTASQREELAPVEDLAYAACIEAFGANESKWPPFKHKLIRETATKNSNRQTGKPWDGYEPGGYYISCQSQYKPSIIDMSGRSIIDPAEFYGGCEAIFGVNAYVYDYMGNVGVKFGLVAILKVGDGKPFGAERPDPSQIFKAFVKPGATASGAVAAPAGVAGARRQL